jgi:hypothetical protein
MLGKPLDIPQLIGTRGNLELADKAGKRAAVAYVLGLVFDERFPP